MHPAVEEPHPHESPVALRADRGHGRLLPVVDGHVRQAFAPIGGDRAESLQKLGAGCSAEVTNPPFVGDADVVAHVVQRRDIDIGVGCAHSLQHRLGADDVGEDIVDAPAGQRCRCPPLLLGEPGQQSIQAVPYAEESCQHIGFVEFGDRSRRVAHAGLMLDRRQVEAIRSCPWIACLTREALRAGRRALPCPAACHGPACRVRVQAPP